MLLNVKLNQKYMLNFSRDTRDEEDPFKDPGDLQSEYINEEGTGAV